MIIATLQVHSFADSFTDPNEIDDSYKVSIYVNGMQLLKSSYSKRTWKYRRK